MAKNTTLYRCTSCSGTLPKWQGQCPHCDEWNTLEEATKSPSKQSSQRAATATTTLSEALTSFHSNERHTTGIAGYDKLVGGGMVTGSILLLAGHPGVGKSTLTLQLIAGLLQSSSKHTVSYVCGEESPAQIAQRWQRLGLSVQSRISFVTDITCLSLVEYIQKQRPTCVVVDSIQTLSYDGSAGAGSMQQIKLITEELMHIAKATGTIILLIGQVNKDGDVAGPQALSHLVDVVMSFHGDSTQDLRILHSTKNRFGSTNESLYLSMGDRGLQPVADLSALLLKTRTQASGSALYVNREGNQTFLQEVQTLCLATNLATPRRSVTGWSSNRLQMLLAVFQKHLNINTSELDVFASVVGGVRINESGADLAYAAALLSSIYSMVLPEDMVFCAEIGLAGELRPVSRLSQRMLELKRMGIKTLVTASAAASSLQLQSSVHVHGCLDIGQLQTYLNAIKQ